MTQAPGQSKHVDDSPVAQFIECVIQGPFDIDEILTHVFAAEQLVWQGPPTREDLVGQFAPQHPPVGYSFAGHRFRKGIEGGHSDRRKCEEVAVLAAVDDKGVPELLAGLGQRSNRIGN